jgi:CheY-like chemotaxis protein
MERSMATQEVVTTAELANRIHACSEDKFTGQLDFDIKNSKIQRWSLYFHLGALVWATSEVHPIRRWRRQLSIHCPQLALDSEALANLKREDSLIQSKRSSAASQRYVEPQFWDNEFLATLVRLGKVRREEITAVVEGNIIEILFDVLQQWNQRPSRSQLTLIYRPISIETINSIDSTLVSIRTDQVWRQVMQVWEAWQQAALVDFSPNLAPVISKAGELQRQTSPLAYHNLVALADGNQSFRDLAVKLRQNLVPLTQSLMPYIRKGLIEVVEVADVNYSSNSVTPPKSQPAQAQTSAIPVQPQPSTPLVVYIDDSPNDSRTMSYILSQAGYRFINVQDPVKALPTLLEHKPDLIFLDLVMPVANGYEICAQIRRISAFKDTPVIILTSNDGIVDRVRAKMVGSSGFLTKPIESDKVLKTLQRHLVVGQGEIDRFKSSQFSMD